MFVPQTTMYQITVKKRRKNCPIMATTKIKSYKASIRWSRVRSGSKISPDSQKKMKLKLKVR